MCKKYTLPLYVSGKSIVTNKTEFGKNTAFSRLTVVGKGRALIGDNFRAGTDCLIITSNHNYMGEALPYDNTNISEDVIIEDNVWLGSRTIILPGIKIGEGAIIQAGALVVKDVPSCAIAGGSPATIFKYRDKEKYVELKKKKAFHNKCV